MLEISLLTWMCLYTNRVARSKGYAGWTFAVAVVASWLAFGVVGTVVGMAALPPDADGFSAGWLIGYLVGVVMACGLNAVAVNLLAERPTARQEQAERGRSEEQDYVAWRKRQLPTARRVDDEAEPAVVELAPADATPPPAARRVWRRKWGG